MAEAEPWEIEDGHRWRFSVRERVMRAVLFAIDELGELHVSAAWAEVSREKICSRELFNRYIKTAIRHGRLKRTDNGTLLRPFKVRRVQLDRTPEDWHRLVLQARRNHYRSIMEE